MHIRDSSCRHGLFGRPGRLAGALVICVVIGSFLANSFGADNSVLRNGIYRLKHLSSEIGQQILTELGIGEDISRIENLNALVVTSKSSRELAKATAIFDLIDSEEPYVIKT